MQYSILDIPGKSNHFPGKVRGRDNTFVHLTGKGRGNKQLSVQSTEKGKMLNIYEDMPLTNVRERSIILYYYS